MSKLKKCLYIINLLERKGSLSLKEINYHFSFSSLYDGEIPPRTFARYKEFILENFPCEIEYDARIGKYTLVREGDEDSLYDYLLSAYHIQGLSELALKHHDKVYLNEAPTGVENVQLILEAIDQKRGIECDYSSYSNRTTKHLTMIPYFLKTWEQRWYLVAEPDNPHHGQTVFALERMGNLQLTKKQMLPHANITVQEYFDGSFGINHSDDQQPETVRIKVYGAQADYVRALPIHESQQELETGDDWSVFEYRICPCYNFYQQLLWHREKLEVLAPAHVREEMKRIAEEIGKFYR